MKFSKVMENLLQHGRELIQKEPLKSSQIEFYAAELLPKLSEQEILTAIKHHSLDNHWPSVNEILAFNQQATSDDKAQAEKLVQRAMNLLRHPQNGGHERAQAEDPEAYAILQTVGRWYDIHTRTEHDLKGLRYDLKDAAKTHLQGLKQGQQALSSGQDSKSYLTEARI
jgi:hypothetical protein